MTVTTMFPRYQPLEEGISNEKALTKEDNQEDLVGSEPQSATLTKTVTDKSQELGSTLFAKKSVNHPDLTSRNVSLSGASDKDNGVYDRKLNELREANAQLLQNQEQPTLNDIRNKWIKDNADKFATHIGGADLGMTGRFAEVMGASFVGIIALTNPIALSHIASNPSKKTSVFRESEEKKLRQSLQFLEQKYLEQHPNDPKQSAFEYATAVINKYGKDFKHSDYEAGKLKI